MPSVGPTEVLLVLVIALLVLGPHRLPEMARQLGRGIRQFREAARNVTREMGAEDLVEDLKGLNQARGTFGETVRKELGLDELGAFPDGFECVFEALNRGISIQRRARLAQGFLEGQERLTGDLQTLG